MNYSKLFNLGCIKSIVFFVFSLKDKYNMGYYFDLRLLCYI